MAVLSGWVTVLAAPIAVPSMAIRADAATPTPTPGVAGDTRSAGEGPGLVGAPLVAIGAVLVLGGIAALLTLAYVRLTGESAARAGAAESAGATGRAAAAESAGATGRAGAAARNERPPEAPT